MLQARFGLGLPLAVLLTVVVMGAAGALEAHSVLWARSSDGRISFFAPQELVTSGYRAFCSTGAARGRCESFDHYDIDISVEQSALSLTFVVQRAFVAHTAPLALSFECTMRRERWFCVSGQHRY